ncbi:UPF0755 protein [Modestobacter sp. DSM 44400]|uniref:endolytic transglycosylase MltG n=1 Tax=Modestobacter sp. DSM 44400 TaxID=1550230 RepID=UPI00089D456D|nr:endolytic transglycosylase MltG [Modestobacter sp. DSM 44400]SDX61601.1 UPF0755 protein [Modestobacter sp. DSM 44400]
MSRPIEPRSGRHASPESGTGAGRSAAELLAAWAGAGTTVVAEPRAGQRPDEGLKGGTLRGRRSALETDAGVPAVPARRSVAPAPRTAAMPAIFPRVPSGRPLLDEPAAAPAHLDGHADAETQPGRSSGASRPRLGGRRAADRASAGRDDDLREAELPSGDLLVGHRNDELAAAHGLVTAVYSRHHLPADEPDGHPVHDDEHAADLHDDGHPVFDETGGLEVIAADDYLDDDHFDDHHDGGSGGGRGRGGGGRGGRDGRGRKRSRPVAAVLSLLVLAAVVAGVVFGGQALLRAINPAAEDYSGAGSGSVDILISDGDSLRAIAGTLVEADVIASSEPFLDAAKAHPQATGIQPGVYRMAEQMSGASALDLLLDPATRQLSRVTVPEGLTVAQTLQRLADTTGIPLPELQAAAMDTADLGLPPYANGLIEGFLFPATYDVEPGTAAIDVLKPMVARAVQALDELQIPVDQRLTVLTKASIVQAESGSVEDMGKVARVLENRLADGMRLQLDTTVNYANGKAGVTTSIEDRANPSPYNTYANDGLPPGAISSPGEQALEAVLSPTPGDWLFFVVVDPDTGDTRFSVTADEHAQNVALFQQWLRDHPNG